MINDNSEVLPISVENFSRYLKNLHLCIKILAFKFVEPFIIFIALLYRKGLFILRHMDIHTDTFIKTHNAIELSNLRPYVHMAEYKQALMSAKCCEFTVNGKKTLKSLLIIETAGLCDDKNSYKILKILRKFLRESKDFK